MGEPVVVTAALTGCVHPASTPGLPTTPEEVAADAKRCANEGATVFHVHARDAHGNPAWGANLYRAYVDAVRDAVPGAVTCVSLSGRHFRHFEHRSDAVRAGADMGTVTLGSVDWPGGTAENGRGMVTTLLKVMGHWGVRPEFEAFDLSHLYRLRELVEEGKAGPPMHVNLFANAALPAVPRLMRQMIDLLPDGATFSCVGLGREWLNVAGWSTVWGGHARVGMEDALWMRRGVRATNLAMVRRIVEEARRIGREPATPEQAREALGL